MITREIAGQLYGYQYQLIDKEGKWNIVGSYRGGLEIVRVSGSMPRFISFESIGKDYFVLCRPYSDLTKEIEPGVWPIEQFEIGEDGYSSFPFEFDHGNTKIIKQLAGIAQHNLANDINYLPYPVVEHLMRLHFPINLPDGCWKTITI